MEVAGKDEEDGGVFTIAVVGGGGVGKSSLIRRFIERAEEKQRQMKKDEEEGGTGRTKSSESPEAQKEVPRGELDAEADTYEPTLHDEYTIRLPLSMQRSCVVTFIDTAGQEQYVEARREAIGSAQGFLLVYDVTQRMSFEECEGFVDDVCRAKNRDSRELPMLVVANKCDRPADKQVKTEDLMSFAEDIGCPWREVSAADGRGVEEALRALIELVDVSFSPGKEGNLAITPSTLNRWKKYRFVLKGNELSYFGSTKTKPKGVIKLEGMIEVKRAHKDVGREDALAMVTPNGTFYFGACNRKERDEWFDVLKRHVRAEMMKRFNFPFEEAKESELRESTLVVDLDPGRHLTSSGRTLLTESGRKKRTKQTNKAADLMQGSGNNVPTVTEKSRKDKEKEKEKSGQQSQVMEAVAAVSPKGEDQVDAFTVAVLGGGGVGKSSLITRFLKDDFYGEDTADPTLQDEYSGRIMIDDRECVATFIDTAGQEQYVEARREAIGSAQGFLLVYDVTQRMSFEECEGFVDDVCRVKNKDSPELPILMLGNKNDRSAQKQVSTEELRKFAEEAGCPWREVCAASGDGIKESLRALIELISVDMSRGKEGHLWLATSTNPRWKKRWFVLRRDELRYYKNTKDVLFDKQVGLVKLEGMIEVRKVTNEVKRDHSLLMVTPLGTLYFSADSEIEMNAWLDILKRHVRAVAIRKYNVTLQPERRKEGKDGEGGPERETKKSEQATGGDQQLALPDEKRSKHESDGDKESNSDAKRKKQTWAVVEEEAVDTFASVSGDEKDRSEGEGHEEKNGKATEERKGGDKRSSGEAITRKEALSEKKRSTPSKMLMTFLRTSFASLKEEDAIARQERSGSVSGDDTPPSGSPSRQSLRRRTQSLGRKGGAMFLATRSAPLPAVEERPRSLSVVREGDGVTRPDSVSLPVQAIEEEGKKKRDGKKRKKKKKQDLLGDEKKGTEGREGKAKEALNERKNEKSEGEDKKKRKDKKHEQEETETNGLAGSSRAVGVPREKKRKEKKEGDKANEAEKQEGTDNQTKLAKKEAAASSAEKGIKAANPTAKKKKNVQ